MSRQIKGWMEQDAYTGWRKYLCYMQRAGAVKKVKRHTHKRERREAKREIRDAQDS